MLAQADHEKSFYRDANLDNVQISGLPIPEEPNPYD